MAPDDCTRIWGRIHNLCLILCVCLNCCFRSFASIVTLCLSIQGAAGGAGGGGAGGAGAGGSAVAGAGLGPVFAMVDQVQFMAICGRVGGQNASQATSAFSESMDWINFSPPDMFGAGGAGGRRAGGNSTSRCDKATCGWCVGSKFGQKIIVCVGILVFIGSLRWGCCALYMRRYPQDPKPPDLSYPNWEGPVLCMQLFGLSDVCVKLMISGIHIQYTYTYTLHIIRCTFTHVFTFMYTCMHA